MTRVLYTTSTILSVLRRLVYGDRRLHRLATGVTVLVYMYLLSDVLGVVLNLSAFVLRVMLLFVAQRLYLVMSVVTLNASRNEKLDARTRAMTVALSVMLGYVANPHAYDADLARVSQLSVQMQEGVDRHHRELTEYLSRHGGMAQSVVRSLQLPSSIDALKCACLAVVVVAALKQSNTNPKPTMLEALFS